MRAGVATLDITPTQPVWLGGFAARTKPMQGIRQHVFAKALALRDDRGATAVLVTADLLGFTRELSAAVARRAEQQFQIPRRLLLFNASHTHSAPVIGDALAAAYPLADADRTAIRAYTATLEGRLVDLIGRALADLSPAQLSFAQGLAGVAVNRRRTGNPEYPNVTDPDVPVLTVRGENGAIRAVVFGYACHNTTLDDDLVSGDWAGYAQAGVEAAFPGSVALFVQGCGADANPLPRHSEELAKIYGKVITDAVGEVVRGKSVAIEGTIQAAYQETSLPLEKPPSREEFERRATTGSAMERKYARMMLEQIALGTLPTAHLWQAQGWRIGRNFTLLALGGEVVADYALRFKREYGFRGLWVAGYSNDVFAYIPSRRVWQEGGYEGGGSMVPYGLPARFDGAVEDLVVEAVHSLMKALALP